MKDELLLAEAPLAVRLDQAIDWADAHVADDWTARLLLVPPLLAHILWFQRDDVDRLYLVDGPENLLGEPREVSVSLLSDALEQVDPFSWPDHAEW